MTMLNTSAKPFIPSSSDLHTIPLENFAQFHEERQIPGKEIYLVFWDGELCSEGCRPFYMLEPPTRETPIENEKLFPRTRKGVFSVNRYLSTYDESIAYAMHDKIKNLDAF